MNWLDFGSWGQGQRSCGSLCMQKQLVIALSLEQIDGFLPNLDHVCILQSQWTESILGSWVIGQRSWAHYVCKNSFWRILDFRVMRSKIKGSYMYMRSLLVITIFWEPVNGLQLNLNLKISSVLVCKIALWRRHHFDCAQLKFHLVYWYLAWPMTW